MNTMYPKSYVVERVEARAVSVKAKLREYEGLEIELSEDIDRALGGWVEQFEADIRAAMAVRIFNVEDARRSRELAKQAGGHLPGEEPVGVWTESLSAGQQLTRRKRESTQRAQKVAVLQAELDAINHVKAYLDGTPVDEFSLTQLRTLGLLDFVKFDLARAKESAR